jgi:hypothetical protein
MRVSRALRLRVRPAKSYRVKTGTWASRRENISNVILAPRIAALLLSKFGFDDLLRSCARKSAQLRSATCYWE